MYAIQGGKILTMDKGVIEGGQILVEGNLIKDVQTQQTAPQGYTVINAAGKYICPGFIDSHTHIGLEEEIYRVEGDDVNETSDPITPQLQALDGVNLMDLAFRDALRTSVIAGPHRRGQAVHRVVGQADGLVFIREVLARHQFRFSLKTYPDGITRFRIFF